MKPFECVHSAILITGGAMGMGRLYAARAARDGASDIVLWDRDAEGLEVTADELRRQWPQTRVHTALVDLADAGGIRAAAEETRKALDGRALDALVNNAGIVRGALFWEHSEFDIVSTMAINAVAPMLVTAAFLPAMRDDVGRGKRILNVASAAATLPNPRMSVYAGSKWALLGWSESLRVELAHVGADHIAVTTFCPAYISTGMFAGARGARLTPILTPEFATERAWRGMLSGEPVVMTPWTVRMSTVLRGLLGPRAFDALAGGAFGVYSTMDTFTGRTDGMSR